MKPVQHTPTSHDVMRCARAWKVEMTQQEARSFLAKRSGKIRKAMRRAANEVIREEMEHFGLDQDDEAMTSGLL